MVALVLGKYTSKEWELLTPAEKQAAFSAFWKKWEATNIDAPSYEQWTK